MLEVWESYLQQQGAIMDGKFNNVHVNKSSQEDINRYSMLIDEGYLILDSIQNEISEDPLVGIKPLVPDPESVTPPDKSDIPWPQYQGTTTNVGFTGADGPVYGRIAWKFPVGLAWESRPVVEGDKVYLASPGNRNILYTLDINTGDKIALVGQNGAGKTTLVKHLNGICANQAGSLLYKEQSLQGDNLIQARRQVGILFQDPDDHLFNNTIYEDVAFGPMNQGLARDVVDERVRKALERVELDHLMFKAPNNLSLGQKKRAAFAAIITPDVRWADDSDIAGGETHRVGDFLATFRQFPPRQRPASFSIDQVMEKLVPKGG